MLFIGQKVTKGIFGVFNSPKNDKKFLISALVSIKRSNLKDKAIFYTNYRLFNLKVRHKSEIFFHIFFGEFSIEIF